MPQSSFDAVIIGAGHNGLIAACYLAQAGHRVLILEKNADVGGATLSKRIFPGIDARVSVYAYLVSLLPPKILSDLNFPFQIHRRAVASYTPIRRLGTVKGLLINNYSEEITQKSFLQFTGNNQEYGRFHELQRKLKIFAGKVWPTLLSPLPTKEELQRNFQTQEEQAIWEYLIEKPLSYFIEDHLSDDILRGLVFTDAKIGVSTYPEDPSLLQNRTFLYHVIGQGTGEWCVPVGGMGALVDLLQTKARSLGVVIETSAEVVSVGHALPNSTVYYMQGEKQVSIDAHFILFNTASNIINHCLPNAYPEEQVEGSVFKLNMVLKKLPRIKDPSVTPREAFTGTFHLNEGYQQMRISYINAQKDSPGEILPGEMYCHSLTDPSILSVDLSQKGYHTLTLFGLDIPYRWFAQENARMKAELTAQYIHSINNYLEDDLFDCLALDADGNPCLDAKSPLDLETSLGLPRGNIFHGNLSWPFTENPNGAGTWGVETNYENVYICGSSAKRGGAVSGIPGHNAAMKILMRSG